MKSEELAAKSSLPDKVSDQENELREHRSPAASLAQPEIEEKDNEVEAQAKRAKPPGSKHVRKEIMTGLLFLSCFFLRKQERADTLQDAMHALRQNI